MSDERWESKENGSFEVKKEVVVRTVNRADLVKDMIRIDQEIAKLEAKKVQIQEDITYIDSL